ncbi:serine hydrolase domain-containing protein [Paenibacillus azoreducens]|uniref:Serine hydrolase FLP n=1 Tax=Paenibacillus azoreducens TaxID=116718 RepID=A0A920CRV0_9BACL|nr:serine hydrolase domain-containing protein [Paenibacillus azoreducens]GIO46783.1 serine hydrolase FLP [Paenibacillus azoreducens]
MEQKRSLMFRLVMILLIMFTGDVLTPLQTHNVHANPAQTIAHTAKIDTYVESLMNKLQIPGVAVGIVKGEQVVYLKGYGISGPNQQPITPQTPFIIGSSSKSFTALATMQLVEQGKINLDAPVQNYLPNFRLADQDASRKILVKDLLHQVSGLSTYDGRRVFSNTIPSIDELIVHLKHTSLTEPVGSTFQYSNLNYDILGGIVQSVSNESYSEYIQNHIFKPLEMRNSFTSTQKAKNEGLATGYQSIFGFMVPMKQPDNPSLLASGYLISSAEDMANYLIAQLNNGRFRHTSIASAESISQMHQPYAPSVSGYYGMGWEIGGNTIHHSGDIESFHSDMILDGDTGIVVLINSQDYLVRGRHLGMFASGINEIMKGQEPSQEGISNISGTYVVIDLICSGIITLMGISIYNLFKWSKKGKTSPFRIFVFITCLLIFNIIIPAAILIIIENYLAPWSMVFSFLPGIGHLMFTLCLLSLCIGIVKVVLLIRKSKLFFVKGVSQ